jgi:hypothetical protein
MNEQQLPKKPLSIFDNCPRGFEDELMRLMDDYARAALAANVPQYSDLDGLAHELWAVAQLPPGQGITDGVERIKAVLLAARGLAANVPAGFVLVPVEPTPGMVDAGREFDHPKNVWAAMLAAAPAPEDKPEAQQPLAEEDILDIARYWSNKHFVEGAARFLIDFARGLEERHSIGASGEK